MSLVKRLYLVGIDALPLWLIRKLCKEKGFRGFKRLMGEKAIVEAESVLPPTTGPAWPSIYTGLRPDQHGVRDFFVLRENYTPDIAFYDSEREKPFWETLAANGLRCLVITPATVVKLSKSPNVDMISGFPLPPKANTRELGALMREHRFYGEADVGRRLKGATISLLGATGLLEKSVRARIEIADEMLSRHDYDFIYVCFTETDRIQHFVIGRRDWKRYLLPLYRDIDTFIERLLARVDEEGSALMLVSDHGMQKIKSEFLINSWLVRKDYARLKQSVGALAARKMAIETGRGEKLYAIRDRLLKTNLRRIYNAVPLLFRPYLLRLAVRIMLKRGKSNSFRVYPFDFDMRYTKAFAFMSVNPVCAIWINDRRFTAGSVSIGEEPALKLRLISDLSKAKDARGLRLFKNIYDAKRYYRNSGGKLVPDLLLEGRDSLTIDSVLYSNNSLFAKPGAVRSGDHNRYGVFGFYPRRAAAVKKNFTIMDVAPATLSYFGR